MEKKSLKLFGDARGRLVPPFLTAVLVALLFALAGNVILVSCRRSKSRTDVTEDKPGPKPAQKDSRPR